MLSSENFMLQELQSLLPSQNNNNTANHNLYNRNQQLNGTSYMPPIAVSNLIPLVLPFTEQHIRDVWAHNLEDEFRIIRRICKKYHYIAMDTEFPGVVARPIGNFKSVSDYQYQLLRCNVDLLKIIQIGFTFMDDNGKTPPGFLTWQFNFKFSLKNDMYAQDSIDLLQKAGLQFQKHEEDGIDPDEFAQLLMMSGTVLMNNIKWLSFHSGYDFGYLLKLLTVSPLPADESDFFDLVQTFFPCVYDIKYLMKSCRSLKGGLQEIADQLDLERIGPQHTAGSDSLLTGAAFFKMREMYFEDSIDDLKYSGHLYGLGAPYNSVNSAPATMPSQNSLANSTTCTLNNSSNLFSTATSLNITQSSSVLAHQSGTFMNSATTKSNTLTLSSGNNAPSKSTVVSTCVTKYLDTKTNETSSSTTFPSSSNNNNDGNSIANIKGKKGMDNNDK